MEKQEEKRMAPDQKNVLEWVVFGISSLTILAVFSYLIYYAIQHKESLPMLQVEYSPQPAPYAPYRYHVIVHNRGGSTAKEASMELQLKERNGTILERATLSFPWIPQNSKREGWVFFSQDPATADTIVANVLGFNKP